VLVGGLVVIVAAGSTVVGLQFDAVFQFEAPTPAVDSALAKVQKRSPKAKVVLISGSAAEVPAAAQGLATAWVRKPFEVGEILAVLRGFSLQSS